MEQNFNPYTNPTEGGLPKEPQPNGTPPFPRVILKPNYFELFAFGFAMASLFSCTFIYTAYIFAGLAILFAILSRGPQMKLSSKSKWSILLGIAGIVLSTVLLVGTFLYLLDQHGSLEGVLRYLSESAGLDFEKEFGSLFE